MEVLLGDGDAELIALDTQTGEMEWKHSVDLSFCHHVIYLSYARDVLLVVGSSNKAGNAHYYLRAFNAKDGSPLWQNDHRNNVPGVGGDHGEQVHHPAIVGNIIYTEPCAHDLMTGVRVDTDGTVGQWSMPRRKGCGRS